MRCLGTNASRPAARKPSLRREEIVLAAKGQAHPASACRIFLAQNIALCYNDSVKREKGCLYAVSRTKNAPRLGNCYSSGLYRPCFT